MNALGMTETSEKGAMTTINWAVNPELAGISGVYYINCKPAQPSQLARQVILVQDGGACDTPDPLVYLYCPKKDANFSSGLGGLHSATIFSTKQMNDFLSVSQDTWHSVFNHQLICKAWLLDNKILAKICKIIHKISFVLVTFWKPWINYSKWVGKTIFFFSMFDAIFAAVVTWNIETGAQNLEKKFLFPSAEAICFANMAFLWKVNRLTWHKGGMKKPWPPVVGALSIELLEQLGTQNCLWTTLVLRYLFTFHKKAMFVKKIASADQSKNCFSKFWA